MNMRHKGFTLIELLVVIAIIAILAAILFPVFANARDKARQISDLSNIKQIALSFVQYTGDYDDTYPIGNVADTQNLATANKVTEQNWKTELASYAGSTGIFLGPNDTNAKDASGNNGAFGIQTSYGVNALEGKSPTDATLTNVYRLGVFSEALPSTAANASFGLSNAVVTKLSEFTQPTATILLADLQSSDVSKALVGNYSGYGNSQDTGRMSLIGSVTDNYKGATFSNTNAASYDSADSSATATNVEGGYWAIPNPKRPVANSYPAGPAGLVSSPFSSKSLTNFAFADGHAKAMKPAATNPDGVTEVNETSGIGTADTNNMWLVNR
jgi:prepilin-type N-terminal cleavage/methylation domain-containing protein/prepilin-type processing-associated H-X9-DG protein